MADARQYAGGRRSEDSGSMLDSFFRDRNHKPRDYKNCDEYRRPIWLGRSNPDDAVRLLLQPPGRDRVRWARRATLCVDRARHDGNRRLGHTEALWQAMVRETSTVLL